MRGLAVAVVLALLAPILASAPQDATPAGSIRIGVLKNGSYEVVTLPLEEYIPRVLAGEALPGSEPAALQALAIAIRTYALANMGRHRAEGFDLCDQTHCQVMRTASAVTERAAQETADQVLLYNGVPATIYYSASCGGRTEKPSNVWPGSDDPPYLPSRRDDGCGGVPEWSTQLALNDLQRALSASGFTGVLRNVRVASRNESGRASKIALDGLEPDEISGQDLRAAIGRTIGWQYLQSTSFELKREGNAFRFTGHGAGHGVGMCVIGSTKLAIRGMTATEILGRYYPGTEIARVGSRLTAAAPAGPPPTAPRSAAPVPAAHPLPSPPARADEPLAALADINVLLPEGDEGERAVVASLVRRERDDVAKALGMPPPLRLVLRFHPTTDAYERATRQSWFTLGWANGVDLHFVPLVVLRERGVLERAVRRQLVHVIVDPILDNRPAWVREGAAIHFAERVDGPSTRVTCPVDAELERPLSAGALGDAYVRARACFERQLASGKSWREIR